MTIIDQLRRCITQDNIIDFNRLIVQVDGDAQRDSMIIQLLSPIAVHRAINILNRILEYPLILRHIANDPQNIDCMLMPATTHGSILIVNRLLEIPIFLDYVIAHPYEIIMAATGQFSHNSPAVLNRFIELTEIGDCIAAWDNQAFICARAYGNLATSNRLLEFPDVFDFVDSCYDKQHTTGDCISSFMEYYFTKLNKRMTEFSKANDNLAFNVDAREAKLCFLILRNLIKTYFQREALRQRAIITVERAAIRKPQTMLTKARFSVNHLRELIRPRIENVHLKRITQLLALPAMQTLAHNNNNQLLRLAIGLGGRHEIVNLLRNVVAIKEHENIHPIDEENERNNPIDFVQQYTLTHPTAAVIAYEIAHPRLMRLATYNRPIPAVANTLPATKDRPSVS
jgi:hypothetical protein